MRVTESPDASRSGEHLQPLSCRKGGTSFCCEEAMCEFSIIASPASCKMLDLKASYPPGCDKAGVARYLRKVLCLCQTLSTDVQKQQTVLLLPFHWLSWQLVAQQPKRWRKVF